MEYEDSQKSKEIVLLLKKIGITDRHIWKLVQEEVGISDLLLLTKQDLVELELPIAARNRILILQQNYA